MDLESAGFDGDILFDIEWPGIEAKDQALQVHVATFNKDHKYVYMYMYVCVYYSLLSENTLYWVINE